VAKSAKSKNIVQVRTLPLLLLQNTTVYHQVQTWIVHDLDPLQLGFIQSENKLVPLKTDLPAAPERILNITKFNCKNCET
jgi:hypothetical protein